MQPAEVEAIALELVSLYEDAQAEVQARLEQLAATPARTRQRAQVRELQASIEATVAALRESSQAWVATRLPVAYELGGTAAASEGGVAFSWQPVHSETMQALATQAWDSILEATTYVEDEAKRWARREVRRQTGLSVIEGRTPEQAARALVSAAGDVADAFGGPVGLVRYSDGSYRRLADWADAAIRTTTANVYNAGALNQYAAMGFERVIGLDGSACHLYGHDDGPLVNGQVFPLATAMAHPLGHPRCRRSWSAAPADVRTARQAQEAGLAPTDAQRADQAEAERQRTERLTRQRQPRTPRAPRQRRTPRAVA